MMVRYMFGFWEGSGCSFRVEHAEHASGAAGKERMNKRSFERLCALSFRWMHACMCVPRYLRLQAKG